MRVTGRIHYIVVFNNLESGYFRLLFSVTYFAHVGVIHVRQKLCGNLTCIPVLGCDFMIHFLESSFYQNFNREKGFAH